MPRIGDNPDNSGKNWTTRTGCGPMFDRAAPGVACRKKLELDGLVLPDPGGVLFSRSDGGRQSMRLSHLEMMGGCHNSRFSMNTEYFGAKRGVSSARYNLPIILLGFTCIVGFIAVIGIARALRARSVLNENRTMRNYIRRITSDLNRDF